jgi:16S rRNA (cytidine1402-2'-O)-methyltransferase
LARVRKGTKPVYDPQGRDRAGTSFVALGMRAEATPLQPGLHLVATPIGNLADISLRALSTLAAAEAILAEDTRVTRKLLAHYGITTPMERFDEQAAATERPRVLARLAEGATLALVSDAGTPLVSDPGSSLVRDAAEAGIPVFAVPGASALLAGLVVSGLPAERFFFEGFLPTREAARRRRIREIESVPGTLVFFEAPHRVIEALADLAAVLGGREAAVARELTKAYETVERGTLDVLAARFAAAGAPRGEIVILVGPPHGEAAPVLDLDERLSEAMTGLSVKDAAAVVAAETGLPKRTVYARAVQLAALARD